MNRVQQKSRCHSTSPHHLLHRSQELFVSITAEGFLKEEANNHIITSGRWLDSNEII